jgi:hypothetical protein
MMAGRTPTGPEGRGTRPETDLNAGERVDLSLLAMAGRGVDAEEAQRFAGEGAGWVGEM